MLPSIFALLTQCCLWWLGRVHCMDDGRIPKDQLYGELANSTSQLKGILPSATKTHAIVTWEMWKSTSMHGKASRKTTELGREVCCQKQGNPIEGADTNRMEQVVWKRAKWKESSYSSTPTGFVCSACSRDCHPHIGLHSHTRKCYI